MDAAAPPAPFVHCRAGPRGRASSANSSIPPSALKIQRSAFSVQRSPAFPCALHPPHPPPRQFLATLRSSTLVNAPSGDIFLQQSRTCADPIQASPPRSPGALRSRLPASIFQLQPTEAHPATRPMHPDGGSMPAKGRRVLSLSKDLPRPAAGRHVLSLSKEMPRPAEGRRALSLSKGQPAPPGLEVQSSKSKVRNPPRRGTRNAFLHPMARAGRVSRGQRSEVRDQRSVLGIPNHFTVKN